MMFWFALIPLAMGIENCSVESETECLVCETGFLLEDGACVLTCTAGYEDDGVCMPCHFYCSSCTGPLFSDCTQCSQDYFLLSGYCYPLCPSGFSIQDTLCTEDDTLVLDIELTAIEGLVQDASQTQAQLLAGSELAFYPDFDSLDPWPVDGRGYYFTGNSILQLPPHTEASSPLLFLSNQFTLLFWVYHLQAGPLFAKQNEDSTMLQIDAGATLAVTLNIDGGSSVTTVTETEFPDQWALLIIKVYIRDGIYILETEVNQVVWTTIVTDQPFADVAETFMARFGADHSQSEFWTGFLWSAKFYNELVSDLTAEFTRECSEQYCECLLCPRSLGECLSTCSVNQTQDDCVECDSACDVCVDGDSCNLCYDPLCAVCQDWVAGACTQCVANAELSNGECTCRTGFGFDELTSSCLECDSTCAACYTTATTSCLSCSPGYFLYQSVCLERCPTGLTEGSGVCEGASGVIVELDFTHLDGVVTDQLNDVSFITGDSELFYPEFDSADPFPAKYRGYYFNNINTYLTLSDESILILSPMNAIALWTNPSSYDGALIVKTNEEFATLWSLELSAAGYVLVSATVGSALVGYSCEMELALGQWQFVGVKTSIDVDGNTVIVCYLDSRSRVSVFARGYFEDAPGPVTIGARRVGTSQFNSFYEGFVHEIKLYNVPEELAPLTDCLGECEICPSHGACIPNCPLEFYPENSLCFPCLPVCAAGCVRNSDCRLCEDQLCYRCEDYEGICTECIANAILNASGVCECEAGTYFSDGECKTECYPTCSECESELNGDCSDCIEGFVLDENGLCLSACEIGSVEFSGLCEYTEPNSLVLHWIFDEILNEVPDRIRGYLAFMGSSSDFFDPYDLNDPFAIYKRGLYFNGNARYIQLPPHSADEAEVTLGNTHSFGGWVLITEGESTLVSKNGVLAVELLQGVLQVAYQVKDDQTGNIEVLVATAESAIEFGVWVHFGVSFGRSGPDTIVAVYINDVPGPLSSQPHSFLDEVPETNILLGSDTDGSDSMSGFLYEFKVWNYPRVFDLSESIEDLINCDFLEYYDGECLPCDPECTLGCVMSGSCSLNLDPLCLEYSGFEIEDCTLCVELAEGAGSGCECVDGAVLESGACVCTEEYTANNNQCDFCKYHLREADVIGYFSEDYLRIVFEFAFALQEHETVLCEDFFTDPLVLGVGAVCTLATDRTVLTVTLGSDATVEDEIITFKEESLYTDIHDCDKDPSEVSILLEFRFDPPEVFPTFSLALPHSVFLGCGSQIEFAVEDYEGGYNRPLEFKWIFDSNPFVFELNEFDFYSTEHESIIFDSSQLQPTVTTVTVFARNWLGFETLNSEPVHILDGQGISISYDEEKLQPIFPNEEFSIFVKPDSGCRLSIFQSFEWAIIAVSGDGASADEATIFGNQTIPSKLVIPSGALTPGAYTFSVSITDIKYQLQGSRTLLIEVNPVDLEAVISPTTTIVSEHTSVELDASGSYDPSQLPGDLEFEWTCVTSGISCTAIIPDPQLAMIMIPENAMSANNVYDFTVTVSKDTRTDSAIVSLTVIATDPPGLVFSDIPPFVNPQRDFQLEGIVDDPSAYEFEWSILSGGNFEVLTPFTLPALTFAANSLTEGSLYELSLMLRRGTEQFDYTVSFVVNSIPRGGSFSVEAIESKLYLFRARNWVDPDDHRLTYQFGYLIEDAEHFLNVHNQSDFLYTRLPPPSGGLRVFVQVYDSFGSYGEVEATVSPTQVSDSIAVKNMIGDQVYLSWSDPSAYPGLISELSAIVLLDSELEPEEKLDAFAIGLEAVDKALLSIEPLNAESMLSILQMLRDATVDPESAQRPANKDSVEAILEELLEESEEVAITQAQLLTYAEIVQNINGLTFGSVTNTTADLATANELLVDIAQLASRTLPLSAQYSFSADFVEGLVQAISGTTAELNFTVGNHSVVTPALDLPRTSIYEVLMIVYDEEPTGSNEKSGAVEFRILDANGQAIELDENAVTISIPLYDVQSNEDIECVFWDSASGHWAAEGCQLESLTEFSATCSCTHFSLYSAGSNLLPASDSSSEEIDYEPLTFWYTVSVCGVWVLSVFLLFICVDIRDKSEKLNRVKAHPKEGIKSNVEVADHIIVEHHPMTVPAKFLDMLEEREDYRGSALEFEGAVFQERELTQSQHEEEVEYLITKFTVIPNSVWWLHYFVSGCVFIHRDLPSSARANELFFSLLLQIILNGLVLWELPPDNDDKVQSVFEELAWFHYFLMLGVAICCSAVAHGLLRIWHLGAICGIIPILLTAATGVGALILAYFLPDDDEAFDLSWFIVCILTVVIDACLVQPCKVLIGKLFDSQTNNSN